MVNQITELVFILDKSGSMAGFEEDTVGGFNSMIERQRKIEGKAYVSTVLFSNGSTVIHDRVDINDVKPLTLDDYYVGGGTALLDAIGEAMRHIGNVHKYARPEDVPERTAFIITTDGMENASFIHDSESVKAQIKQKSEKYGWEFIFLAANIDAIETAGNIGIRRERAMNYMQSHDGVSQNYSDVSRIIKFMRNKPEVFCDMDINCMHENCDDDDDIEEEHENEVENG